MSPYDTTAADLAAALTGRKRVEQTVDVIARIDGGALGPQYDVLVTPKGAKRGDVYRVRKPMLALIQAGTDPYELDLEPEIPETDEIEWDDEIVWTGRGPHDPSGRFVRMR